MTGAPGGGPQRMSVQQVLRTAGTLAREGKLVQAEGLLRQILQQRPNDAEVLHQLAIVVHRMGNTRLAVALIERAIGINPNAPLYHANVGEMQRRLGQPRKAIEHGRRAIELNAEAPDPHNNLGIAYFDIGDFEQALRRYDTAIALRPRFAEAISNRGNALRQLHRYPEAEADYRRALTINPSYPEAWNNLGSVLRDLERPVEAEQAYRRALTLKPNYLEALNNLILALKDQERHQEALNVAGQALAINPNNADALAYSAAIHVDMKKLAPAFDLLKRSLALAPNRAEAVNVLGRAYFEAGDAEKAIEAYSRASALRPGYADPHNNMGNALRELGRFDEAIAQFETALELNPQSSGTYLNLSDVKTFRSSDDTHLAEMEKLYAQVTTDERRMHLSFALAKAYNDLDRNDEAFPLFATANALKRKTIAYDETAMLGQFERLKLSMTAEVLREKAGNGAESQRPIFVIGMPRSGTTLVEQILASHSMVKGLGELRDMSELSRDVRGLDGRLATYPEYVRHLSPSEIRQLGQTYLARTEQRAQPAPRATDKMPSNFLFLGLIHLILPNAKIVHLVRDPVDTCLSCFTKLFAGEQPQTYDLAELGRYYRGYHGLMAHWREVLPAGSFLDVRYEAVVADIESEARRLLAFCDLPWEAGVVDFHRSTRPIKTASSTQVRRPIYTSSVARWRKYERHLGPLLRELGDLVP